MKFSDFLEQTNRIFLGYHCNRTHPPSGKILHGYADQGFLLTILQKLPIEIKNKAIAEGLFGTPDDQYRGASSEFRYWSGETDNEDEEDNRGPGGYQSLEEWAKRVEHFFWTNGIRWIFISTTTPGGFQAAEYGAYCYEVYSPLHRLMPDLHDPWEKDAFALVYLLNDPPELKPIQGPFGANPLLPKPSQPHQTDSQGFKVPPNTSLQNS